MTEPDTPSAPAPPAATPARRWAQRLAWTAAVVLLAVGALAGTAWWLARSDGGAQWLLSRVPGVQVSGWRGSLLGDGFSAERLVLTLPGATVTVDGLQADGLRWQWRPDGDAWVGLTAARMQARRAAVVSGPPTSTTPLAAPETLALPLRLRVDALQLAELQIDTLAPLRDIDAAFTLGADAGARHEVAHLRFAWDRVQLQAKLSVTSTAPLMLDAELQAVPTPVLPAAAGANAATHGSAATSTGATAQPAWAAVLRATGPLDRLDLQGTLRGVPKDGHAAPALDLRAAITPFAAWPLASLEASTQALDLGALASAAPETRLSGRVVVDSRAADAPIGARVTLDNALPGRWDEGRLPLSRIELALRGQASQPDRVQIETFDLVLGSPARPAGRWQGSGEWQGDTLQLDTRLTGVRPQGLDGRAPAMQLSGTLGAVLRGLPSPQPDPATPSRPWQVELRTQLDGRLSAAPQAVQLTLEASADAQQIEVRQLRARAGAARGELRASARRLAVPASPAGTAGAAASPWHLTSQGSLTDFDPLPWWPGRTDPAWRAGPHRLSGQWQFDLQLPAGADRLAPLALAQRLGGKGTLQLRDSLLAGVPLQLDLALASSAAGAAPATTLQGELEVGGNRLTIDGRGDPRGRGDADRWALALRGSALAALAPLFKLHPALAAWAPRQGTAEAQVTVHGRWPNVATEGDATLAQLQMGELALDRAQARWQLATGGTQALELQADASGLRLGQQRAEQLHAEVRGTAAQHRIELSAVLPLVHPAWAEPVFGLRPTPGTRTWLQGDGAWVSNPAGGGRWIGRVQRLAAGAWDGQPGNGKLPADTVSADLLDARNLQGELQFNTGGELELLQATPGRLRLVNAFDLRWDQVRIDNRGAQPVIDLHAEVEAFQVAPLLARLQPTLGWRGDLALGARIDIQAAEKFDADIVVERRGGDLQVAEDTGSQALGLTDLRASLSAHDGQWTIAQALAGRALGEMAGAVKVRTAPGQRWPAADAPLEGVLQARVANLGIWGAWVPPGWRLAGELTTSATIGGTFGAPEYTGQVRGTGLGVRNALQGVNVSQGEVLVLLKGATAQIERFTLRAGEGSLTLTGGADFGSTPNARLTLQAQRFRALGRIDRQLTASGNAELLLRAEQIKLDGKFTIDEALFDISRGNAPTLDDDVTVRRTAADATGTDAQAAARPRRAPEVDIEIQLGEQLRVRGHGVDTGLRGRLRISTPAGKLAVRGTVNTNQGNYAAYGQKLEIERGIVAFSGAVDNPRLDVLALRPNLDIQVGVAITGTAQLPRIRLYSDPDMSDTDKLSWLMLGRAPDGLGSADTALLQRAALALLAGEGDAPTDTLLRNLGLDELSVRQSDGDARETVVTIGKQLSRRWYVGYERGVNAASGTFQLIYRIAQRFTLRAQSGEENSLDLIWVWRIGEPVLGSVPKSPAAPP